MRMGDPLIANANPALSAVHLALPHRAQISVPQLPFIDLPHACVCFHAPGGGRCEVVSPVPAGTSFFRVDLFLLGTALAQLEPT